MPDIAAEPGIAGNYTLLQIAVEKIRWTARDFFPDQPIKAADIPRYFKTWIGQSWGKNPLDSERFFPRSTNQSRRHTKVFQGLDWAELGKKIRCQIIP